MKQKILSAIELCAVLTMIALFLIVTYIIYIPVSLYHHKWPTISNYDEWLGKSLFDDEYYDPYD